MEGTKPDVLQDGPRDEQRTSNDNQEDINSPLSSASEGSTAEDSRNEGDDGPTDPPLYSPLKNFCSRPPPDAIPRPSFAKTPLLRPSVFSGSLADVGGVTSKPDSGSLTSVFGARPNPFALSSRDQISTASSSKPFLLRPSKLGNASSEVDEKTTYSPFAPSIFGSKPVMSSDTSTDPPPTATTACRPVFLRPSKLDAGSEQNQPSSDQTSNHLEKHAAVTSEPRSDTGEADNSSKPTLLRPSQLAATPADLQISEKAKLPNNPFARVHISGEEKEEKGTEVHNKPGDGGEDEEAQDSKTPSPPKFVRLNPGSSVVNPVMSVTSPSLTFVFGQNLLDRVATKESTGTSQQHAEMNGAGSSEMLFTSVVRKEDSNDGGSSSSEATERPSKSLSDAAREYEESRAAKRKYEEVAVVTGEEDEANVMQMNCKLYAFDKTKGSWVERGRGTLRLNDRESARGVTSRVVVRTAGSLRVVINTKVWAGMVAERASPKSLRLTAMDSAGEVRVFLLSGSQKDTEQLLQALHTRVLRQRAASDTSAGAGDSDAPSANPEPKRVAQDASGDGDEDDDGGGGGGDDDGDGDAVGHDQDKGSDNDNDNGDADTGEAGPAH